MRIQIKDVVRFRSKGEILEGKISQQTFNGKQVAITLQVSERCAFTTWVPTMTS